MLLKEAIDKLNAFEEAQSAYRHAMSVLGVDGDTAAPKMSVKGRGRTLGYLSGVVYQLTVKEENREMLETILAHKDEVDEITYRRAEEQKEALDEMTCIPMDEYIAYEQLATEANAVWHEAKLRSDYAMFAPYLDKMLVFQRRFAQLKNSEKPAYDVMLDRYEKGMSMAVLDPFFALLREKLTPVILAVKEKPAPRMDFLHAEYPVWQQRIFSDKLMALMGIDRDRCSIAETEHPFTAGSNKWDVRITTHYYEHDVSNSMYSVIHEGGHAMYDMGIADELQFTSLADGASMSLHESQSRFYENIIGRSLPFCKALLPVMQECFPEQMKGITAEELYRAVNESHPSLIRTQADELTYAMHVMIRYELEKKMIAGDVKVSELPEMWNDMYERYLGVRPTCDREGILQDSHWAGGLLGYFPSYALGSAYGAQMLIQMEKDIDFWPQVEKGDLSQVTAWLGSHVHTHGLLWKPQTVLQNALGAPFDPQFYVDYLTKKYTALYNL